MLRAGGDSCWVRSLGSGREEGHGGREVREMRVLNDVQTHSTAQQRKNDHVAISILLCAIGLGSFHTYVLYEFDNPMSPCC